MVIFMCQFVILQCTLQMNSIVLMILYNMYVVEKVVLNYQMMTTMLNWTILSMYMMVIKIMKLLFSLLILITMSQVMIMYSCKT